MRSPLSFEGEPFSFIDVRSVIAKESLYELPMLTVAGLIETRHLRDPNLLGAPVEGTWSLPESVVRRVVGHCVSFEVTETHEAAGAEDVSRVRIGIAPSVWLASKQARHRTFQRHSELEIAAAIYQSYGANVELRVQPAEHPRRELRMQYGEPDLDFARRMLEQAGVSVVWREETARFDDDPATGAEVRALRFADEPQSNTVHATRVRLERTLRPGQWAGCDYDLRLPAALDLWSTATAGAPIERSLERAHYVPGAFNIEVKPPGDAPTADDRGAFRTRSEEGERLALRRLEAKRASSLVLRFDTTDFTVRAGDCVTLDNHPDPAIAERAWLVVEASLYAVEERDAVLACRAVAADARFRPPIVTPRPSISGVQVATVVGAEGDEIHVDEHGRVRVRFAWERERAYDPSASPWLPVNQPWAGKGYGTINIPRVGQAVVVGFFGGDPDVPYIVGRVYNATNPVPYALPKGQAESGWKSNSTGGGGGFSQIQLVDDANQEKLRIRAQRDRGVKVIRDEYVKVQGDRHISVGTTDSLAVTGRRHVNVWWGRTRKAKEQFELATDQEMAVECTTGWIRMIAKNIEVTAPVFRVEGPKVQLTAPIVRLVCGASKIELGGDAILVDSPLVEINVAQPGQPPVAPNHPDLQDRPVIEVGGLKGGGVGGGGRRKRQARRVSAGGTTRRDEIVVANEELPPRIKPTEPRPFEEPDGEPDVTGDLSQPADELFVPPQASLAAVNADGRLLSPSSLPQWNLPPSPLAQLGSFSGWLAASPADIAGTFGMPLQEVEALFGETAAQLDALGLPPGPTPLARVIEAAGRAAADTPGLSELDALRDVLGRILGGGDGGSK